VQQFLAAKIKDYTKEINRYDQDKKLIKTEAENFIKEQEVLIPFSVFSFQFSVKRLLIIRRLSIKFVAAETELGIKRHNRAFALAVMLLQIAIMMSAVAALINRKMMWGAGLVLSVVGLVYMANGFFLWF
jgi:hypothetical protein